MADPVDDSQDQYLQSVLQGQPGPDDMAPPSQAPQQSDPTQVSGVTVAPDPSTQQGINYSAPDIQASQNNLKAAMQSPSMQAPGGSANPGVWGLLPQGMQHGTLRNVLGALGDAFLVGSGHQAQYTPRMERQQEGLAMASYPDHPEISRGLLGMTGAPDSIKDVIGLQENQNNVDLHKDQLASQTQYRQDRQDAINANNASLDAARKATAANQTSTQIRQLIPQVTGRANTSQNLGEYTTKWQQADALAKHLDPTSDATKAFGLVAPEMWSPGMQQGLTAEQQQLTADKASGRDTTQRGQDLNYKGKIGSASISAGQRSATAAKGMGERDAGLLNQANQPGGLAAMSDTDQARVKYLTTKGSGGSTRPPLTDAAKAAAANGPGGKQPQQQYSQVHTYPSGKKAGWNGKQWVPIQ